MRLASRNCVLGITASIVALAPTITLAELKKTNQIEVAQAGPAKSETAKSEPAKSPVTWEKHTYAKDHFEVEFSGPVKLSPTDIAKGKKSLTIKSTNYMQDNDVLAYIVTESLYKNSVLFDKGIEANRNSLQCKTTTIERPIKVTEGIGREIESADCVGGFSAYYRFYTVGKEFFQVLALFKPDGDVEAAHHFVNSFHYVKK